MDLNIDGLYVRSGIISTFTGKYIDTRDPQPDQICIEDIAHQLSMQPRFGGRLSKYYCVAQHCIEASMYASKSYALETLMHDASEAYICDMPSPIKSELPQYYEIEERLMKAIAAKFNFRLNLPQVKVIDKYMLELEWSTLVKGHKPDQLLCMNQEFAEKTFLELFYVLERKV
jgi:uncharacterized protein